MMVPADSEELMGHFIYIYYVLMNFQPLLLQKE